MHITNSSSVQYIKLCSDFCKLYVESTTYPLAELFTKRWLANYRKGSDATTKLGLFSTNCTRTMDIILSSFIHRRKQASYFITSPTTSVNSSNRDECFIGGWLFFFFLVKPHRLLKCLTHHISRKGNHHLHKDALDRRTLHVVLIYVLQWLQYVKAPYKGFTGGDR